jgi:NADH:ubiquinone oxidoreductase subunit E
MLQRVLTTSPFRVAVAKSTAARVAVIAERKNFFHSSKVLGSETVNVVGHSQFCRLNEYYSHLLMTSVLQHRDTSQNNLDTQWDFTAANYEEIKNILKKYPPNYKRSAVMPLLFLAQKQSESMPEHGSTGWIPLAAMNRIASVLDMPPMRVYEVATFYTMYNRNPIGKHNIQVCTTSPCMVCGAYEIVTAVKNHLGVEVGGECLHFNFGNGLESERFGI